MHAGIPSVDPAAFPGPPARWTVRPGLAWTSYPDSDDWVVYNPASADMHLVNASARHLWTLVAEGCSSADDLAAALAAHLGRTADDEIESATRDAISSMDDAGLIDRARP
jgi:PqqD family protein of HPr-rel-A system